MKLWRIFRQDNFRVCAVGYHPCEHRCNRKDYDEAVNVRGFERFLADNGKVDIERENRLGIDKKK